MSKDKKMLNKYFPREGHNYESDANRFTLNCQLISLGLLICMWILNQLDIFIVDKHLMTTGIGICCGLELIIIVICQVCGYEKEWMKYVVLFFSVLMTTVAGIYLTYHTLLASVLPLLYSMQYKKKRVVYYTYVLTLFSMTAIVLLGFYYGVCDANMLLLTTSPISDYVNPDTWTLLPSEINANPLVTLPLYYVMPRMVILLAMIPVMQFVVNSTSNHAAVEAELKRMGEIDQMTHLYNRNKYIQMVREYFPKVEQVAVLFWDINGLKTANDSIGHDAGDYIITVIAKTIFKIVGTNRFAYRVGGDEFVMIIENPKEKEIETLLEEWNHNMQSMNMSSKIPLSASVGYAVGRGSDIEELIKEADNMMYDAKRKQKEC